MRSVVLVALITISFFSCQRGGNIILESSSLRFSIDNIGNVAGIEDRINGIDYHYQDSISPVMSVWTKSDQLTPLKSSFNEDIAVLTLVYEQGITVEIKVEQKPSHLVLEVISISNEDEVELVIWGPYQSSISKTIGETVGVVRNDAFAFGIQSLNPKTLGGYPWNENDAMPQLDIFESGDNSDLSEKGKRYVLYRVEAAKPTDFGSSLQAYTRNRSKERIIKNWSKDLYVAPAYEDGGFVGSKIALFGSEESLALETLGKIEIEEGLPHPLVDGVWGKTTNSAAAAYLIIGFNEDNVDQAIAYTKQAGLRFLYHDGPFKNWGHFELGDDFPNGKAGLKNAIDKAEAQGISVGLHTLSNFITTDDPYVTPIPDPRLAIVGSSPISEAINSSETSIPITSPDFFAQLKNNNLKTVRIGTELVRYQSVSKSAPWKLLDCQRGAYGTTASSHVKGDLVNLLADHGYKVFLTSPELGEEMAETLAELFNETGLRQISFDGVEGNRSTGMGNYGEILFTNAWFEKLDPEIKNHLIVDASRTSHYFWHTYTRMNWGEPWYADFRESQTEYRLKNQKYFQRNYMPAMLGWFKMWPTTSIEDIEWMLARSAAFNAGYAFVVGFDALEKNGYSDDILYAIGEWEKARMADAFSESQRLRMENISNEFHLETLNDQQWRLHQVHSFKFRHEKKVRQPGEPLYSEFEFENSTGDNTIQFNLTAADTDLSKITLELDNYKKIAMPVSLKNGQTLKYTGGDYAIVYDSNWQRIRNVDFRSLKLAVSDGNHSIGLDCIFSNEGKSPMAKLEIRLYGEPEPVGKAGSN